MSKAKKQKTEKPELSIIQQEKLNLELISSCAKGTKEQVETLLNKGAKLNCKNIFNESALSEAVKGNNEGVVKFLIEQGCNVNRTSTLDAKTSPLHIAASNGFINILKLLLGANANVDQKNTAGDTPLHSAVNKKPNVTEATQKETIELLLRYSADPTITNKRNQTPSQSIEGLDQAGIKPLLENAEKNWPENKKLIELSPAKNSPDSNVTSPKESPANKRKFSEIQ